MNRWYPYESHAEQWRKSGKGILLVAAIVLLDLGLAILNLANDHWEVAIFIFVLTFGCAWLLLGLFLNAGTFLRPWVPYCEKPEVKEMLASLRALEREVQAQEESMRARRAAEARRESQS